MNTWRIIVPGALALAALVLVGLFAADAYVRHHNSMLLDCGHCAQPDSLGAFQPGF